MSSVSLRLIAPSGRPRVSGPNRVRNHGPMCDHIGVLCDVGKSVAPTTRTAASRKDVFQVLGIDVAGLRQSGFRRTDGKGGAEHLIYPRKVGTRGNTDSLAEHRVTGAYGGSTGVVLKARLNSRGHCLA